MAGLSWLNSDNSTAKGEWKNNPTYRSTWQIYQSCVITIGLCVWQAVHMNIPPPSERPYKQTLRRVGFVILALIAPEVVALNAWAQLREAKHLCDRVNRALSPKKAQTSDDQQFTTIEPQKQPSHYAILTKVVLCPVFMLDKLRMLVWHNLSLQNAKRTRKSNLAGQTNAAEAPSQLWTLTTAFYALSGGLTITHRDSGLAHLTLSPKMIYRLCNQDPECLRHIREPEIVDRSKVSWIAKAIVCGQSLWFCSQCISRVSMDLAITLLELNTFIHCISACCIYLFWWYKPYDLASHTIIKSSICEYEARMSFQRRREWFPWTPLEFNVFSRKATTALRDTETNTHQRFMTHDLIPYEDRDVRTLSQDTFDEARKAQTFNTWGLSLISSRSFKQMHDNSLKVFVGESIPDTGFSVQSNASTNQDGYILLSPRSLEDWKYLWEQHQRSDDLGQYAEGTFDIRLGLLLQKRRQNFSLIAFHRQDMLYSLATFTAYGAVHLGAWNYRFTTRQEGQVWRACAVYTTAFMPVLLGGFWSSSIAWSGPYCDYCMEGEKTRATSMQNQGLARKRDTICVDIERRRLQPLLYLTDTSKHGPPERKANIPAVPSPPTTLPILRILPLCIFLVYPFVLAEVLSRAFLVVESFIAVPNSPREVYAVVPWSSYLPHLS
ncbi:hypothetical protein D0864_04575 [Hortaea werneckii]|nr:hypothetical protein D0864_04575 [Hortaea werneckii]